MKPRNPYAIALAVLTFAAWLGAPALGALDSAGCVVKQGNCFKKDLSGKEFEGLDLTHSRWFGATLRDVSFKGTNLYSTVFRNADLADADLSYGNRTRASFRGAKLYSANLSRADFYGTNFQKANLRFATIIGTNFNNTNLTGADFTGAYMKFSSFAGARLCNTIQPDGKERDDDCGGQGSNAGGRGDCCFPGHSKPAKDQDKGDGQGNGGGGGKDEPADDGDVIVGEL
mgnify:CR=1 FL=1